MEQQAFTWTVNEHEHRDEPKHRALPPVLAAARSMLTSDHSLPTDRSTGSRYQSFERR